MTPAQRANFDRLLAPRHVAVIGGGDAAVAINELRRIGYPGDVWPVNPRRSQLAGVDCYSSVHDLPQPPDAVFLAVPATAALDIIAQLARIGAGGVVCYTAGFSADGSHGPQADRAVIDAAGELALVGPNCYGLINYIDKVALWPFAHGGYCPGYGAAVITQSGMLSSDITMNQRSLPLAFMVSAGNQSVLRLEDYVSALCERPQVRAIGLHIEGLHDIAGFCTAASRALELGVPIVALKTGTSTIGAQLTVSHTGSLSGDNELYQALFERLGIVSVTSPTQLIETIIFLWVCTPVYGVWLMGFTCSGGGATMLADYADYTDLHFDQLSDDIAASLRQQLPPIASVSNPLDYTTPIWGNAQKTRPVFDTAMADGCDAAILVQDYPRTGLDESKGFYRNDASAFIDAANVHRLPAAVCSTLSENIDAETRRWLIERGVAPLQGIHEGLEAINSARWYWGQRGLLSAVETTVSVGGEPLANVRQLDEARAKSWLARAGFDVPAGRVCDAETAPAAAGEIGFPVVLKVNSPAIAHKTEAGAVAIGLADAHAVARAIDAMRLSVANFRPELSADQILVESMQPAPVAELLVSIRSDVQFGWAMTLASGGVLVDLLADAVTLLLPATIEQLKSALSKLAICRLLAGYRGSAAADVDRLAAELHRLAAFTMQRDHAIAELEINPLFVYPRSACVVDVLLFAADQAKGGDGF